MSLVGSLVGPLGSLTTGGTLLDNPSKTYDYAIGELGFKLAINDNRPYERATAPFRKDQFDSQSEVGDQSLTGWWKRGQLSFHKGAGINYYEVLDGQAITNRFATSGDVTVSEPGEASLGRQFATGAMSVGGMIDSTQAEEIPLFLSELSQVYSYANGTTPYTPTTGLALAVAGGPNSDDVWISTDAGKIERTDITLAAGTVYYTYGGTGYLTRVWYAKNRLWVLTSGGDLYQLAPVPSVIPTAIAGGDLVCTFREPSADQFLLAESPSAVYLAHSSGVVYAITINADGSIPTITAPVEATRLPQGDTLVGLSYYLGFLVLQTTTGVRLAAVDSSGGLSLGPQFLDLTCPAVNIRRKAAGIGNKVFVTGSDSLVSIDLSEPIADEDLTYAWCTEHEEDDLNGVTLYNDQLVTYSDTGISIRSKTVYETDGYLITGQHRFGTLEPKHYHAVRVLAKGASGSIVVSRVSQDGTPTSLYTIDVTQQTDVDVDLGLVTPVASLGLRFDLQRSVAGETPILLGYQLRVLPVPRRQRMVRVPLMCFDADRRQPNRGGGSAGSAWRRLSALEDLELSGAVTTFQDFRTGETGQCFIETVEFENKTPPSAQDKGYGGVVYVTIRKL